MPAARRVILLLALSSLPALLPTSPAAQTKPATPVTITPRQVVPGGVVLVKLRSSDGNGRPPVVTVGKEQVPLYATRTGFEGLAAVPIDAPPGPLSVELGGEALSDETTPTVSERRFPEVEIEVEEVFVDPPPDVRRRLDDDNRAVNEAYRQPLTPPLVRRAFAWPRPRKISGRFGDHRLFNGTKNSRHLGVDLAGKTGAPVRAANDGEVVLAQELFYSGNTVIVHHGAGVYTGYFHLSAIDARVGEELRRGAVIGRVGATGRTTGPHLHFAVRAGGSYVDPEPFMRLRWIPRPLPPEGRAAR